MLKQIALALVVMSCAQPVKAVLVAEWELAEGSGATTLETVSGQQHSINNSGGPTGTLWSGGVATGSGSSLLFSTTNQPNHVAAGNLGLPMGSNFTFAGWVNMAVENGSDQILIGNALFSSSTGWMFGVRNGDLLFDLGSNRRTATNFGPEVGVDTFVAFVHDDTNNTATFFLSVEGSGIVQSFASTDRNGFTPRSDDVNLGVFQPASSFRQFRGELDLVQIYNHALTPEEIRVLALGVQSSPGSVVPEPASMSLLALGAVALIRRRRIA